MLEAPDGFHWSVSFLWSDKHLKRSGLDYISSSSYQRFASWNDFIDQKPSGRLIALVPHQRQLYYQFSFEPSDFIMVGSESCGFPEHIQSQADVLLSIPMDPMARSLNVVVSSAIVVAEALKKTHLFPF